MAIPSAFAVLRLITNSYRTGRSAGRSAGFTPPRIRAVSDAQLRKSSCRFGP